MEAIANGLQVIAIILVLLILVLLGIWLYMASTNKRKEKKEKIKGEEVSEETKAKYTSTGLPKESIYSFMEFDDIKDNMIIRKNGQQYVMVIQCQGVNYDLMSEDEKIGVEEGFVQFLNTIRFPIQLYVQTRTLNLRDIVEEYKTKVRVLENDVTRLEIKLKDAKTRGKEAEVKNIEFQLRRKRNVLEYGADITDYVAKLSSNQNVLQQKTYIVVSYYASELGGVSTYSKDEIDNICFSELYTRSQSVIRSIAACEVMGRILDSEELAELLYVAYNRDESEILQLSKVLDSEYDALYSTSKDVLEKKKELLDEKLTEEAVDLATESIIQANKTISSKKENKEEIKTDKEKEIQERALEIVEQYKDQMAPELYEETKKEVVKKSSNRRKKAEVEEKKNKTA
jgi:hypothetical protein